MPYGLVYVSTHKLQVGDDGTCPDFLDIAAASERNNRASGVSSYLVCTQTWFCQLIEGREEAVRRTFERIAGDHRHDDLRIVAEGHGPDPFGLAGVSTVYKSLLNRLIFLERGFSRTKAPYDRTAADLLDLMSALHQKEPATTDCPPSRAHPALERAQA